MDVPGPRRRWRRRLGALLLGVLLAAFAVGPAAAADNELVVSDPAAREQVDRPPGFVTLAFSDEVDPSLAKMLVQDASGANVTTGELVVEGTNLSSQLLDDLPPGTYTVTYRLARTDGQPQGGTFQFSYGPGTFTDAAERTWSGTEDEPEVLKNENPNAVTPAPPPSDDGSGPGTTAPSTSVTTLDPSPTDPTPTDLTPSPTPAATSGPGTTDTGPTGSPAASSAPTADPAPSTGALVLAAVALVTLAAAGVAVALRRRAGRHEG